MKLYVLLWPYMIYNPMYMPIPPLAVRSMSKKQYIPRDTYKKVEAYKNNIVQYNIRAQIKGR